jgi:hypothetical protein
VVATQHIQVQVQGQTQAQIQAQEQAYEQQGFELSGATRFFYRTEAASSA